MTVEGHETELSVADEVRGQLDVERTRHASLEQRGAIVISTSGALITLLFAVAGVTAKSSDSRVIGLPLFFTWAAIICLVFAAFLGIYLNVAHATDIKSVPMPVLEELVKSGGTSKTYFMYKQMEIMKYLQSVNKRKSYALNLAFVIEALGIASLAVAAWIIL